MSYSFCGRFLLQRSLLKEQVLIPGHTVGELERCLQELSPQRTIGLLASTEIPLQRGILPPILQMLSDSNPGVRDAAILCIEAGTQFNDELQRHHLPMSMVKDINARLERIESKNRSSDDLLLLKQSP